MSDTTPVVDPFAAKLQQLQNVPPPGAAYAREADPQNLTTMFGQGPRGPAPLYLEGKAYDAHPFRLIDLKKAGEAYSALGDVLLAVIMTEPAPDGKQVDVAALQRLLAATVERNGADPSLVTPEFVLLMLQGLIGGMEEAEIKRIADIFALSLNRFGEILTSEAIVPMLDTPTVIDGLRVILAQNLGLQARFATPSAKGASN